VSDVVLSAGQDPDHPGRFKASITWDNFRDRIHEKIEVVGAKTLDSALEEAIFEWREHRDQTMEESL
jgi:hypothetical protein